MAPPPLAPGQSRLLDALLERVAAWTASTPDVSRVIKATVLSVSAGAADDGNALAVITWADADVEAPYLASYTPVAGHVVAVAKTGSQLLILGRILGTPS